MPRTVDIRRVERYQQLMLLLLSIRRRRRLIAEYQALLARIVRSLDDIEVAELEVSVYDSLHDRQAKRFKDAMVSRWHVDYRSEIDLLLYVSHFSDRLS